MDARVQSQRLRQRTRAITTTLRNAPIMIGNSTRRTNQMPPAQNTMDNCSNHTARAEKWQLHDATHAATLLTIETH